jgi:uncharacterized protein
MEERQEKYINPYLGGTLLGIVLFLSFFITGNGLGASGAINRIQVALLDLIASDHVDKVAYLAHMAGGNLNALDNYGIPMLAGTFLGGLISGLFNKRVRLEVRKGPQITNSQRLWFALIGGLIMGYGARMARGCTSGQALSGGAVLATGSWVFMLCVFAGGYAFAYFFRKLWN